MKHTKDSRLLKSHSWPYPTSLTSSRYHVRSTLMRRPRAIASGIASAAQGLMFGTEMTLGPTPGYSGQESDAQSVLKSRIDKFNPGVKVLMKVLDEVARVHPWVEGAVTVFKIAVNLELQRRENDNKVTALFIAMNSMMEAFTLLKDITVPLRGKSYETPTIEHRLQQQVADISNVIEECSLVGDTYQKQLIAVRILTSYYWQERFQELLEHFATHRQTLMQDLQMYTAIKVHSLTNSMDALSKQLGSMFDWLRNPEERDLINLTASLGGAENVIKDNSLVEKLIQSIGHDDQSARCGQEGSGAALADIRRELHKNIAQMLETNRRAFEAKWEVQKNQLANIKEEVKHQGDRVIEAVNKRPHERIVDKDIYQIWKEMGWKGSIKARHLVMALHDFFAEQQHKLATGQEGNGKYEPDLSISTQAVGSSAKSKKIARNDIHDTPQTQEDSWALRYISVFRVQPLIEALDDDVSSFVTITEVNAFTSGRPQSWSLARWVAYWTAGFEMNINWYYRRIMILLQNITFASRRTLPSNRRQINSFLQSSALGFVDDLLAGLQNVDDWDTTDWSHHPLWLRFKDYIMEQEEAMHGVLKKLGYNIDDENTLPLVAGSGRPEPYVLPLLCLLLQRACGIIELSEEHTLDRREMIIIENSIKTIQLAVYNRLTTLRGVYKLQNLDFKTQLRKFFCGMYYYVSEESSDNMAHWRNSSLRNNSISNMVGAFPSVPPLSVRDLFYGTLSDELLIDYDYPSNWALTTLSDRRVPQSIEGAWNGSKTYENRPQTDGLMNFVITRVKPDGAIEGLGTSALGDFFLYGFLSGRKVKFIKEYHRSNTGHISWAYEGEVDGCLETITGTWGPVPDSYHPAQGHRSREAWFHMRRDRCLSDTSMTGSVQSLEIQDKGHFRLTRQGATSFIYRPSHVEFKHNRYKALWKLAINNVMHDVRSKNMQWKVLKNRRDRRRRYIQLVALQDAQGYLDPSDDVEWKSLLRTIPPQDLRFWRSLAYFIMRRQIFHDRVECVGCACSPIETTRLICLDCCESEVHRTVNLCVDCFSNITSEKLVNWGHLPSHAFLQVRTIIPTRDLYGLRELAREALKNTMSYFSNGSLVSSPLPIGEDNDQNPDYFTERTAPPVTGDVCVACRRLVNFPCWICLDCEDQRSVCLECNLQAERECPWLYQHPRDNFSAGHHDWSHSLALPPRSIISSPTPPSEQQPGSLNPSSEQRLGNLESLFTVLESRSQTLESSNQATQGQLTSFEHSISTRLENLEKMFETLLHSLNQECSDPIIRTRNGRRPDAVRHTSYYDLRRPA